MIHGLLTQSIGKFKYKRKLVMLISSLEKFICEKLIASPYIPDYVKIVRLSTNLADEGGIFQGTYIGVSFQGSSANVIQYDPLVMDYVLTFKLEIGSQQYLSTEGHDVCLQLLAGSLKTLNNSVPVGTNFDIERPFTIDSENFAGITEDSQYIYEQVWSITIKLIHDLLPVDPCIRRGFCRSNLDDVLTSLPRGSTNDDLGNVYDLEPCMVQGEDGSVYDCDGNLILGPCENIKNGHVNNSGYIDSVHIVDCQTGEHIRTVPVYLTKKVLLRISVSLFKETTDKLRKTLDWSKVFIRDYIYVRVLENVPLYSDPLENSVIYDLSQGELLVTNPSHQLTDGENIYLQIETLDGTKGWVDREYLINLSDPESICNNDQENLFIPL